MFHNFETTAGFELSNKTNSPINSRSSNQTACIIASAFGRFPSVHYAQRVGTEHCFCRMKPSPGPYCFGQSELRHTCVCVCVCVLNHETSKNLDTSH